MKTETLQHMLDKTREAVIKSYAQNPDDPDYDIQPRAALILERGGVESMMIVPMPWLEKELTVALLHTLVNKPDPPEPIDGVLLLFPGWEKDPDDHNKRVGEIVLMTIETSDGKRATQVFNVKRDGGNRAELRHEGIDNMLELDQSELGKMQGFFHRTKHTRQ